MKTTITVTQVYEEGDSVYDYFPGNTVQVSYEVKDLVHSESREIDEIRDESGKVLELVPAKTSFLSLQGTVLSSRQGREPSYLRPVPLGSRGLAEPAVQGGGEHRASHDPEGVLQEDRRPAAFDEDFGFRAATLSERVAGHSAKDIGPDLIYLVADEAGIPRRSLTGGQYEAIGDAIRDTLRNKSTRAAFARILAAVVDEARDEAESYLDIGGHSFRIGDR